MSNENIVYGPHSVNDALDAGRVSRIWILNTSDKGKAAQAREEIVKRAANAGLTVEKVPRDYLDSRVGRSNHQGIIAKVSPFPYADFNQWLDSNPPPNLCLVIMLDGIQDPGNLGHILRQAAGFKADGVIIPDRRACGVTPTVEKTSAGNAGKTPVMMVTNLKKTLDDLKDQDFWSYATDASGATSLVSVDFHTRSVLIIGGEHDGVSRLLMESADVIVSIPMPGEIDSFNVATSAALALYEYRRKFPL